MFYNRLVNLPVMDLIEQFIKKSYESFDDENSKTFLKQFHRELFYVIGDLSKNEDLQELLDFLLSMEYRLQFALIEVEEKKNTELSEIYGALIIKIRTELKKRGVL